MFSMAVITLFQNCRSCFSWLKVFCFHLSDLRSLDESSQVSSNSSGSSHNSLGSSLEFSLAAAEKKGL
jgi:hypothetical protein